MTDDRTPLRDALAEALDTRVQHYTLSVEPDDSAYMELDPDGAYVIAEEVADAILAHPAVIAALAGSEPADCQNCARLGTLCGRHSAFTGPMGALATSEPAGLLREGIEAFRLTREYVGEDTLPALPGWSWFDWVEKVEAFLAATPTASPTADEELDGE